MKLSKEIKLVLGILAFLLGFLCIAIGCDIAWGQAGAYIGMGLYSIVMGLMVWPGDDE